MESKKPNKLPEGLGKKIVQALKSQPGQATATRPEFPEVATQETPSTPAYQSTYTEKEQPIQELPQAVYQESYDFGSSEADDSFEQAVLPDEDFTVHSPYQEQPLTAEMQPENPLPSDDFNQVYDPNLYESFTYEQEEFNDFYQADEAVEAFETPEAEAETPQIMPYNEEDEDFQEHDYDQEDLGSAQMQILSAEAQSTRVSSEEQFVQPPLESATEYDDYYYNNQDTAPPQPEEMPQPQEYRHQEKVEATMNNQQNDPYTHQEAHHIPTNRPQQQKRLDLDEVPVYEQPQTYGQEASQQNYYNINNQKGTQNMTIAPQETYGQAETVETKEKPYYHTESQYYQEPKKAEYQQEEAPITYNQPEIHSYQEERRFPAYESDRQEGQVSAPQQSYQQAERPAYQEERRYPAYESDRQSGFEERQKPSYQSYYEEPRAQEPRQELPRYYEESRQSSTPRYFEESQPYQEYRSSYSEPEVTSYQQPKYEESYPYYPQEAYQEKAQPDYQQQETAQSPYMQEAEESESKEVTFSTNVEKLIELVSTLPGGVTRQTGAQIIRKTMEAMGLSITEVLDEAQTSHSKLQKNIRDNISEIEEQKNYIRKLEEHIYDSQRKAKELDEIINLFVMTDKHHK